MNHLKFFISVVVMYLSSVTMTVNAQSRYDVNGDGKVNVSDAVSVVNMILSGTSDNVNTPAEAVDLGLPSGTKWASFNLGASSPEEPGGRYAWGETQEKLVYSSSTYVHYDISTGKYRNIGNDICGTLYDAAHVKWGGFWHMPSQAEFEELVTFCTYEWTTFKGVRGGKFTGPNGNSIFLPINSSIDWEYNTYWLGYDDGNGIISGYYGDQSNWFANCMGFDEYDEWCEHHDRQWGLMIRPVCSDISKTKMVDLGLPSGTKWASCNVGASSPEEVGDKYAWGETGTKIEYTWDNYMFFDSYKQITEYGHSYEIVVCQDIGKDISGTKYDVAHVKWGDNWRMPTRDDFAELLKYCTRNGYLFTGPNGNSIFLPLSTNYWTSTLVELEDFDEIANYAYQLFYMEELPGEDFLGLFDFSERYDGCAVRPVYSPASPPASPPATVEIIDLGLPSGTKWASCNVGATKPEEYGGYYAWGETEMKKGLYYWTNYIHSDGSYETCHYLGSDISGTEYDVAHVKWGGKWCMPTKNDYQELIDNCTNEWTTLNGVNGMKFTSKKNSKSIFLPAASCCSNMGFDEVGFDGYYWSSTVGPDSSCDAYLLEFSWFSASKLRNDLYRYNGLSVRPVVRN